jgi:hypothetical protein
MSDLTVDGGTPTPSLIDVATGIVVLVLVLGTLAIGGFAIHVWSKGGVSGETAEQRQARLNSVFTLLQFILGTVAIGILTALLTQSLKEREQILKDREEVSKETEEIGKLITYALSADGEARGRFANLFAHLTRDPNYRKQWIKYYEDINSEIETKKKTNLETVTLVDKSQEANLSPDERKSVDKQLAVKTAELQAVQTALAPLIPTTTSPVGKGIVQLLYNVNDSAAAAEIQHVESCLINNGYTIGPSTHVKKSPEKTTEVRYTHHPDDAAGATELMELLQKTFSIKNARISYVIDPGPPRGFFQVSFAPGVLPPALPPTEETPAPSP